MFRLLHAMHVVTFIISITVCQVHMADCKVVIVCLMRGSSDELVAKFALFLGNRSIEN